MDVPHQRGIPLYLVSFLEAAMVRHSMLPAILFFTGILADAKASHFYGGEIRYASLGGTSYQVEVHVFTRTSSPAGMTQVPIEFGDGTSELVPLTSIQVAPPAYSCTDIELRIFTTTHVFPGPGSFWISAEIANRNGGIFNIPNSVAQTACITALLVIPTDLSTNTSIRFDNAQTLWFWDSDVKVHDPAPVDVDGDSLSFVLVSPSGLNCSPIPGYFTPLATNSLTVDPEFGTILWDHPTYSGTHNFTLQGSEWRNGMLIGQVRRDMDVCVSFFGMAVVYEDRDGIRIWPTLTGGPVHLTDDQGRVEHISVFSITGALEGTWDGRSGSMTLDLGSMAKGMHVIMLATHTGERHRYKVVTY